MRITVPIVGTYADQWYAHVPRIDLDACFPKKDGDEQFDEATFRLQAREYKRIQFEDSDKGIVCAFAAMVLSAIRKWMDDHDHHEESTPELEKIRMKLGRRDKRETYSYCRIIIRDTVIEHKGKMVRGARVRITYDDKDVIEKHPFEHDFAMIAADVCAGFSRRFVERGDPPVELEKETLELVRELHERTVEQDEKDRIIKSNEDRVFCERHKAGFCSPPKFECEHCKNGMCVEI